MPPILVNSQNLSMGVTPQTISTAIVSEMAYYLENNVTGAALVAYASFVDACNSALHTT